MISTEQEAQILELHAEGLTLRAIGEQVGVSKGTAGNIVRLGRVRTVEEREYWRRPGAVVYKPSRNRITRLTAEFREIGWRDRNGCWHGPWTERELYRREHSSDYKPWTPPVVNLAFDTEIESAMLGGEGD